MAFKIDNFISNLSRYGTLQTNKFEVEIPLPEYIRNDHPLNLLNMRTDRVRLPGIILDNIETRRYGIGPTFKTPTNTRFEPVNMSFIETSDSEVYNIFNEWIRICIFDYGGNSAGNVRTGIHTQPSFYAGYKTDYCVDIVINIYNNEGTSKRFTSSNEYPVKKIKLVDAFPISLSDNDLSWGDMNTLYKVNVSFAYSYHHLMIE